MLDAVANFAKVQVSTGYDQNAYSIQLITGDASKLPTAPFNVIWYNSTDYADPSDDPNKEIDRVSAVNTGTDVITLVNNGTSRTPQEGTSASTKNTAGKVYKMINGITQKMITDIQNGLGKLIQLAANGSVNGVNKAFVFTQEPSYIVSDGAWYIVNNGWTWDAGTLTATMTIPPSSSLYGIA